MRVAHGVFVGALLTLGWPSEAGAQTADQLYDEGLKAMLASDYAKGCPALQKSFDLDPMPGALFTVAACYERWGKVYTALQRYRAFLEIEQDLSKLPSDKRATAEERITNAKAKVVELEPKVPTITIEVAEGGEATIDGAPAEIGTPVSVDPGEHTVVAMVSGEQYERTISVAAGDAESVAFEGPKPERLPPPMPGPDTGDSARTPMIVSAFVLGGVGLAGVVLGSVTGGIVLFSKKGVVEDQCVDNVCTPEGKEAADDAKTLGLVSTIGFAAGGACLAAGVLLFFLAPDEEGDSTALRVDVGPEGGGLILRGTF